MTVNKKIRNEKLKHDINRSTVKTSALSSEKIDKYECVTREEILLPQQHGIAEDTEFTYSLLGKALEKQTKTFGEHGE